MHIIRVRVWQIKILVKPTQNIPSDQRKTKRENSRSNGWRKKHEKKKTNETWEENINRQTRPKSVNSQGQCLNDQVRVITLPSDTEKETMFEFHATLIVRRLDICLFISIYRLNKTECKKLKKMTSRSFHRVAIHDRSSVIIMWDIS